jgi:glucose-1-phosphate thymidylyltransferase
LLPIFDKPLIYYPLSTLMLAGIREILIIVAKGQESKFREVLGSGTELGIAIEYVSQEKPDGIAQSLLISENFVGKNKVALILGDNIFHGVGLGRHLAEFKNVDGAQIFGYSVKNPENYGVAKLEKEGKISSIIEKPSSYVSNVAIPGLYFFDEKAANIAKSVKVSTRGELEITDVLNKYLEQKELKLEMLPRGTAWFDSGTFSDMHDAANFVRLLQERTGERVGDPIEIARIQGWVN